MQLEPDTRERIERGDFFSTLEEEDWKLLVKVYIASPDSTPLVDLDDNPVTLVAAHRNARAHVRRKPVSVCESDGHSQDGAHRWIQEALARLASSRFGQTCKLEVPVGEGQRGDAVYAESAICWEVDLSPQSYVGQVGRDSQRFAAGYRMIALMDADRDERNDTHRHLERILVFKLKERARGDSTMDLADMYVNNVRTLVDGEWKSHSKFNFGDLVESIIKKGHVYHMVERQRWRRPANYAWVALEGLDLTSGPIVQVVPPPASVPQSTVLSVPSQPIPVAARSAIGMPFRPISVASRPAIAMPAQRPIQDASASTAPRPRKPPSSAQRGWRITHEVAISVALGLFISVVIYGVYWFWTPEGTTQADDGNPRPASTLRITPAPRAANVTPRPAESSVVSQPRTPRKRATGTRNGRDNRSVRATGQ